MAIFNMAFDLGIEVKNSTGITRSSLPVLVEDLPLNRNQFSVSNRHDS